MSDENIDNESKPAELQLSPEARLHVKAFTKFSLWAGPLVDTGHIMVASQGGMKSANMDLMVAKRFLLGINNDGEPIMEVQAAELHWLRLLPFISVGVNLKSNRLYFYAKPAEPLKPFIISIPVDSKKKLEVFRGRTHLDIHACEVTTRGVITESSPAMRLRLMLIEDEDQPKLKRKESAHWRHL